MLLAVVTHAAIRDLIIRMRQETNWGYTRIMGECKKLGLKVSRQTVKNVLVEAGLPVGPKPNSEDSWDAFLARHAATLWQCDFVTKPMWTPRGLVDLYFLVFLHLGTRRCWISQCTERPVAGLGNAAGPQRLDACGGGGTDARDRHAGQGPQRL